MFTLFYLKRYQILIMNKTKRQIMVIKKTWMQLTN